MPKPKRVRKKYVRPDSDTRKELRAVWVDETLMAQIDLCAAARRWTRASYALFALEEQVRRDRAMPDQPAAAVG